MVTDVPVVETPTRRRRKKESSRDKRPRRQPRYQVVLWNDDDHTFQYVVRLLSDLFALPHLQGWQMANKVHYRGRVVVMTTTREHAELKRDQIHAFGRDPDVRRCRGSMSATIQPMEG